MKTNRNQLDYLKQLQGRSPTAYSQLIRNTFPKVSRYIQNKGGSYVDAEDIFQDALIIFCKKIELPEFILYQGKRPESFLMGIVKNLFADWCVNKKNVLRRTDEVQPKDLITLLPSKDEELSLKEGLKMALEKLPENCRKLLMDYYFGGFSLKIIAEEMGYTTSFIKVKKHRCMKQLKELMNEKNKI